MEDDMVVCACRVDPVLDISRRDAKQDFRCYLGWRCGVDRGSWREGKMCGSTTFAGGRDSR